MTNLMLLSAIGEETPAQLQTGGAPRDIIIREMDGKNRDEYLTQLRKHVGSDGEVSDYRGLQANLLSRSLFDKDTGEAMSKAEIEKLPATTINALHAEAQRLSKVGGAEEAKEDAAKN